jgi:SNF2 family DNA or RNA helicase
MLDRIGDMLEEAQIRYARLDGTMTREDRAKACDDLRYNKKVEILLVSTRAGGVGLNLTAASRCFLVDPYWNPSVEAQAIDRIVCPPLVFER